MSGPLSDALAAIGTEAANRSGLSGLATLAALAVAGILVLTAISKLRAPRRTVAAFADLRLPMPKALAAVVPVAELAVAVALVVRPSAGGILAVGLLLAFTAVLVRTIAAGLDVSCGCLGSLDTSPVGTDAVIRNVVLIGLAVLATATPVLRPAAVDLDAVLVMAGTALITATVMQLVSLRDVLGRLWTVELAGEVGRTNQRSKQ